MKTVASGNVCITVDHLFRQYAGQMVSVLCRIFGVEKIDMVEDAVQDAMVVAMRKWPFGGVPDNPTAWLTQVARNKMRDRLRQGKFSAELDAMDIDPPDKRRKLPNIHFTGEIAENQLRMMYACCHPLIPADSQVALTLKTVGGFSVAEIARAYLAKNDAVAKMLTRAKKKLKTGGIRFEIPVETELAARTGAVLRVLYLMFNEGYAATEGEELIRKDLCMEAIRLCIIVADHPTTSEPKVNALTALFLFQAARFETRTGTGGEIVLLADQDRSLWNKQMLAEGLRRFRCSAKGSELSDYHIEAEIASIHSLAPNFAATDWERVITCYDKLLSRKFSPVLELNRIVAIGHTRDHRNALKELETLGKHYLMTSFHLFHITKAYFLSEIGELGLACAAYNRALELVRNEPIRKLIARRIEILESST